MGELSRQLFEGRLPVPDLGIDFGLAAFAANCELLAFWRCLSAAQKEAWRRYTAYVEAVRGDTLAQRDEWKRAQAARLDTLMIPDPRFVPDTSGRIDSESPENRAISAAYRAASTALVRAWDGMASEEATLRRLFIRGQKYERRLDWASGEDSGPGLYWPEVGPWPLPELWDAYSDSSLAHSQEVMAAAGAACGLPS